MIAHQHHFLFRIHFIFSTAEPPRLIVARAVKATADPMNLRLPQLQYLRLRSPLLLLATRQLAHRLRLLLPTKILGLSLTLVIGNLVQRLSKSTRTLTSVRSSRSFLVFPRTLLFFVFKLILT